MMFSLRRAKQLAAMMCLYSSLTLLTTLLIALTARAQSGDSILAENIYDFSGPVGAYASATPISATGQPFQKAFHITVTRTSANVTDAGLRFFTTQTVNKDDNLQLTFWVRKIAPLDGNNIRGFAGFEKVGTPGAKSLSTAFPCDSDVWTKFIIPFKAAENYAAGEAQLSFQFAIGPQIFEIGGVTLVNLGATPQPPAPDNSALPSNVYQSFFSYFDQNIGGSAKVVSVTGQAFTQAIQITHNGNSEFVYSSGLGWRNAVPLVKGDTMLLSFWARKLEGDVIRAQVIFERNGGNFEKSIATNFPDDTGEWKLYQLAFRSSADFAPGQAGLIFQFAYGPQKFEVGGVSLVNYGQKISPNQLPSSFYYPGRGNDNAAWRVQARDRIERHRKGDLTVVVRDRDGKPIRGATVFVQQANHAFKFGTAVTAQLLSGNGQTAADREIYRSRVSSHFTTTVMENDLKWPFWEDWASWNRQATMNALPWLKDNNLSVRGHNLIWPSYGNMPNDIRGLGPDALRQRIDNHFAEILKPENAGGKCYQWDVINEPYTNYDAQGRIGGVTGVTHSDGLLGNLEMVRWFQNARYLDPAAKLFINDYDILESAGENTPHQNYFFQLSKWLLDNGAPLDGIGLQGHFNGVTLPATMQAVIERFSQLPVTLSVTEFDINIADEALQAELTRDVMMMIFSQPGFTDFLMWGFWEKAHWLPAGAMYRADWSSKPNALVYNDLVFREWWTNENGVTDAAGKFTMRGFKGAYNVTVVYHHIAQVVPATIEINDEVTITLPDFAPRPPIRRERPGQVNEQAGHRNKKEFE